MFFSSRLGRIESDVRNPPQDAGKQIPRDGDLGHLEGDVAAVTRCNMLFIRAESPQPRSK
jgi:hypothetical protein